MLFLKRVGCCLAASVTMSLAGSSLLAFAPPKPIASTPVVTSETPDHAVKIEAELKGAKNLYLVVTDGGNGYGSDWANWAEPKLIGSKGELKLTDLKWKDAATGAATRTPKSAHGLPWCVRPAAVGKRPNE